MRGSEIRMGAWSVVVTLTHAARGHGRPDIRVNWETSACESVLPRASSYHEMSLLVSRVCL